MRLMDASKPTAHTELVVKPPRGIPHSQLWQDLANFVRMTTGLEDIIALFPLKSSHCVKVTRLRAADHLLCEQAALTSFEILGSVNKHLLSLISYMYYLTHL